MGWGSGNLGNGNSALNFRVKAYPTEADLMAVTPQQNAIGIITEEEMPSWIFSVNDPAAKQSEELYTEEGSTAGSYLNASGTVASSSNYSLTTFILLPKNCYQITVASGGSAANNITHAFYDADGVLISTVPREINTTVYDVPSGAASIRLSVRTDDTPSLVAHYREYILGAVWIKTGTSSSLEFNALKKNAIQVYPLSAKQYTDDGWVSKTAKSGINGVWVDWIFYLFSADKKINRGIWNTEIASTGTFLVTDESITISNNSNQSSDNVCAVNDEPIDLTYKNVLRITATATSNIHSNSSFALTSDPNDLAYDSAVAKKTLSNGTLALDVSALSGIYYFKVWIFKSGSSSTRATCNITEITAE